MRKKHSISHILKQHKAICGFEGITVTKKDEQDLSDLLNGRMSKQEYMKKIIKS